ncbi:hypothetical protein FJQ87_17830 [Shewanella sp. SNU WT4]|nr:hypothetical protein FJQ87_17830 [Shewanella sp. SNU WT4]
MSPLLALTGIKISSAIGSAIAVASVATLVSLSVMSPALAETSSLSQQPSHTVQQGAYAAQQGAGIEQQGPHYRPQSYDDNNNYSNNYNRQRYHNRYDNRWREPVRHNPYWRSGFNSFNHDPYYNHSFSRFGSSWIIGSGLGLWNNNNHWDNNGWGNGNWNNNAWHNGNWNAYDKYDSYPYRASNAWGNSYRNPYDNYQRPRPEVRVITVAAPTVMTEPAREFTPQTSGLERLGTDAQVVVVDGRYRYRWQDNVWCLDWKTERYFPATSQQCQKP